MLKILSILVFTTFFVGTFGQQFILPTFRPPRQKPIIIRTVRDTENQKDPLWLYQGDIPKAPASGDHPFLPNYIDDIKLEPNRRYARSVDSPSARRSGGSHTTSSGSRDTGATHPGYNRRNSRDTSNQEPLWLYQGDIPKSPASSDHPFLPNYIDDIKLDPNTRYARSVDSPSARRSGGSHTTSSGSRDTGSTHPGYNRRNSRDTSNQEPLWLNQGDIPKAPASSDHPFLPNYIDDIKLDPNRRYARSVDSPSARRSGGSHTTSSGSRNTGATHPGYNRRNSRDTSNQEPLWLNQGDIPKAPASGDHPFLPSYIDDIKLDPNRRYARSVDSPSARRSGGSHTTSSGSRDTGATHPGYNRRNSRDTSNQEPLWLNQGDIPKAPASGDHPFLPNYIDGIKLDPNRRYARSVDSPSARRSGGSHTTFSGSRDTGATHPGYNRRNSRDTSNQEPLWLNQGDIPKAPASGDHPFLPNYIDDIKLDPNRRYVRDVKLPSSSFMPFPTLPPSTGPYYPFPRPGAPRNPFPIYVNH